MLKKPLLSVVSQYSQCPEKSVSPQRFSFSVKRNQYSAATSQPLSKTKKVQYAKIKLTLSDSYLLHRTRRSESCFKVTVQPHEVLTPSSASARPPAASTDSVVVIAFQWRKWPLMEWRDCGIRRQHNRVCHSVHNGCTWV